MNAASIVFAPLVPWPVIWVAAGLFATLSLIALWRGLAGWALRGLAAVALLVALAQPSLQTEDRAPLADILVVLVDESASQGLGDRTAQTSAAIAGLERAAQAKGLELKLARVGDGADNRGTLAFTALSETLADLPRDRVAGIVVVSDGRAHDLEAAPELAAPLHLLRTGRSGDWDRRIHITAAPAFAIIGEEQQIELRIEDMGAGPGDDSVVLEISVDGDDPTQHEVPIGRRLGLPITLTHGGQNVVQFTIPEAVGELTDRNNAAVVSVNGVRDRLRVLLVSGVPHPGTRTWRNLLKSDSAVDLVHFTILRPPDKQDGVPVNELSLIAFPTRELFMDKIDDFDLIIFDRYQRRGILPALYLDNVAQYVRKGGAVLVAAGPDFASADSLYRSPLGTVLPATPTARVLEEAFPPVVTDIGQRHPVTAELPGKGDWGRWLRQIDVTAERGDVVMSGADDRPLLVLDRVDEGRVALLASDHAWLWNRGYEGGGPQLELLRRLAHWMMKEPELEEEALTATAQGRTMRITRRTLDETVPPVTITAPDGSTTEMPLAPAGPGRFEAEFTGEEMGLYRLENGEEVTVIGLGPAAPREFIETIASDAALRPAIDTLRGGVARVEDGLPRLRDVRLGRPAAGRGWLGLTPRGAYETRDVRQTPLLPGWLVLLLSALFIIAAWLREGRR